ncbi:MAG: chemotaxis response regulator protein-glutamate methylesterase [Zetaproteobacteria bacterium CG_4_9_14_3_um_filter_53_7]|nr:MAG: chemotaxis response regulator protein-glutamate methylesterase [Zetaproteobacteria bacterium CG_4_9_14_3_um_filter_53_7]
MIRILIVEDSIVVSMLLKGMLAAESDFEVVGHARNGEEGVRLARELKPDLITMDIRMPVMDGFEATCQIMSTNPIPIVVISSSVDAEELRITFRAIEMGALAVIEKPFGPRHPDYEKGRHDMIQIIRAMAGVKVVRRNRKVGRVRPDEVFQRTIKIRKSFELVAIGCSTGGPQVLKSILSELPASFPLPVVVVQHISRGFVQGLASWLNSVSPLHVKMAEQGEPLLPGFVYIAPDDKHLLVTRHGSRLIASLSAAPPVGQFRPSATPLMQSVATACGEMAIGMLLSGMGDDGAAGLLELRQAKGHTLVQDQASSVVYGMPGSALKLDAVDEVVNLNEIPSYLQKVMVEV